MAGCADCGESFGLFAAVYGDSNDLCKKCHLKRTGRGIDGELLPLPTEAEAITVTTELMIAEPILQRLNVIIVSVDCVLDVDITKAQNDLLNLLKMKAYDLGANAVVGLDIKFVETYAATVGVGEFKRFKMVGYGTAVVIEG